MARYTDIEEQLDFDFTRARRKASLRRLQARVLGDPASTGMQTLEYVSKKLGALNRGRLGRRVVAVEKIVGTGADDSPAARRGVSEDVHSRGKISEEKGTERMIPRGANASQMRLFSGSVSTDGTGHTPSSCPTKKALRPGRNKTATATNTSTGDTSEFSAPGKVVVR